MLTTCCTNRHHKVENRLYSHFLHEARIKRSIPALSNIIAWVLFCNSPCPCLIFLTYLWKYISISVNAWKSMEQNTKHNQCRSWCNIITHVQPPTCTRRRDVDKNGSSVRNPDTIKQSANDNSCCCKLSQAVTSCHKVWQACEAELNLRPSHMLRLFGPTQLWGW